MSTRRLIREIESQGFKLISQNKHLKFKCLATGRTLVVGKSASDWRAQKNMEAGIRRMKQGLAA